MTRYYRSCFADFRFSTRSQTSNPTMGKFFKKLAAVLVGLIALFCIRQCQASIHKVNGGELRTK